MQAGPSDFRARLAERAETPKSVRHLLRGCAFGLGQDDAVRSAHSLYFRNPEDRQRMIDTLANAYPANLRRDDLVASVVAIDASAPPPRHGAEATPQWFELPLEGWLGDNLKSVCKLHDVPLVDKASPELSALLSSAFKTVAYRGK